jgi:ADP-heptose:LPS heptosyltransferase
MRRIDYVVGNLACSVLAGAKRLQAPFATPRAEVRKIVVMKFFGLGSIVVASPALQALRDLYPGAEIHFVTFKANRDLLDMLSLTDKNYYIDTSTPTSFVKSTLGTIKRLRDEDCDLAIDLEFFAKFPLVLSSLAGVPKKAGFYLAMESFRRTLLDVLGSYNHYYHTKDIFLSLVYLLTTEDYYFLHFEEFKARYRYPRYEPSQVERAAIRKKLGARLGNGPIFVVNPNTSTDLAPEVKRWPEERYSELAAEMLREHPDARIVFIGVKAEREYVERVASRVGNPRAFSVAGELSLRELMALFAEASLVVSNDSGPMHLACLVDAPIVGLFFAETPTLYAPIGSNVRSVEPNLYSIPLFTVYNGKDVGAGRPAAHVTNVAASAVSLAHVMSEIRSVLTAAASTPPGVADAIS